MTRAGFQGVDKKTFPSDLMRHRALSLTFTLLITLFFLSLSLTAQEPSSEASPSPSPGDTSPSPSLSPSPGDTSPSPSPSLEPVSTPTPSPSPSASPFKIYVSDSENGRIVIMDDLKGTNLKGLGGAGRGPGKFLDPGQVWVDQDRYLYVADRGNDRIVKLDLKPEEGLPVWTELKDLNKPEGVAVWGDEVFVSETGANRLVVYKDGQGDPIRTITDPMLKQPGKLWFDDTGRLFVCCGEYPPGGSVVMIAPGTDQKPKEWEAYQGVGLRPTGYQPRQAVLRKNRILSIDSSSNRLTATDNAAGRATREIGSYGSGLGRFMRPEGMALDSQGRIYIADSGNDRIVRIDDPTGAGWLEYQPGRNPNNLLRGPKSIFIWAPTKPKPPEPPPEDKKDKKEK
ncbi:MAG: hypothetical protein AMXMBFR33_05000 [Candidatus Xenobia bacterium]